MKVKYQQQIREAVRQGDLIAAAEASSALARLEPENMEICLLAADLAHQAGLNDQAAEWYAHAARYYVDRQNIAQAVVMMKHYQQLRPEERLLCRQLFRCCRNIGGQELCLTLLHEEDRVCMAFRQHELFTLISDQAFDDLLPAVEIRTVEDGAWIAHTDDPAEFLYLIASGGVRPWVNIDGEQQSLAVISDSGVCGEVPFLTGGDRRTADLRAVGKTTLVCIPYATMHALVGRYPRVKQQLDEYYQTHVLERQLAHCGLFLALGEEERKSVCQEMKTVRLEAGKELFRQGDSEELGLYIIRSGWLSVNVELGGNHHLLYTAKHGDVIGETAILEDHRRFSARAVSEVVLIHWPEALFRQRYEQFVMLRHYIADRLLVYQQAISDLQAGRVPELQFAEHRQQELLKDIYGLEDLH